jgi:hypothetical protein
MSSPAQVEPTADVITKASRLFTVDGELSSCR